MFCDVFQPHQVHQVVPHFPITLSLILLVPIYDSVNHHIPLYPQVCHWYFAGGKCVS